MPHFSTKDRKESDGGTTLAALFENPGSYTYDLFVRGTGEGRMIWMVEEAAENEVTVVLHYELEGDIFDTTISGRKESVKNELLTTPAHPFVQIMLFPSILPFFKHVNPSTGDRFTFPVLEREGSVEITGKYTHAGIEGYTSTWRIDGERRYEDCVAPDLKLVLSATYYPPASTVALLWLGLGEYERTEEES